MTKNEMLSLCKKACNEQDDCKNCPNREKCDDISEIYTLGNLIDENHEFSEEAIIDFYNGFFPEGKEKESKKNKKTDTDDNDVAYVSFYSAAQKILKVNKKTVKLLNYLHEIGVLNNDFEIFDSIDEFLSDEHY